MELIADQLSKEYRKGKRALEAFSYTFHEGIYGLLGPNCEGESTLMEIKIRELDEGIDIRLS